MKELNEEIKLTLNLMQTDIDDGAHGEMQKHLNGLLEMKRNELQQRLVERSWLDHADGMGSVVSFDQAPYKSVKLEGQVTDEAKPLTTEELKAGGWWCGDVSEACRLASVCSGIGVTSIRWDGNSHAQVAYKLGSESNVVRAHVPVDLDNLKQIHRIGNDFYWSEK